MTDSRHNSGGARRVRFASANRIYRQSGVLKAKIAHAITKVGVVLLLGALPLSSLAAQSFSHSSEIVSDPVTGAALMGFDPVVYFIENRAQQGDPALQASFDGKAWYFTSGANRLAFLEKPAAFVPAFGGHDPTALAAGVLRAGEPRIFLRMADQLYFFRDHEARARFIAEPELASVAKRDWPQIKRNLDP